VFDFDEGGVVFGGGLDLAAAGGEEGGAGFELVAGVIAAIGAGVKGLLSAAADLRYLPRSK